MPTSKTSEVIHHLRRALLLRDGAGMTDGQLLACFLTQRDDAAFAALVRRHGPMVWGVCRRVLRNYHDAEDAFQATFLVLVRKAATETGVARASASRSQPRVGPLAGSPLCCQGGSEYSTAH